MRIIIVGAGKVGFTVAHHLACEGHEITIIDKSSQVIEECLETMEVAGISGSGIDKNTLMEAGVDSCELVIALMGSDEQNLMCCLIAKKLGAKSTVARVRSPIYSEQLTLIADDLGLSMAVNPEKETASEIARILEFPLANKVERFARGRVEMIDYEVRDGGALCGKTVKDAFGNVKGALACAVVRSGEVHIPRGNFEFASGDVLTIVAPSGNLSKFFKEAGMRNQSVKNVLICGGGETTYYLAKQLLSQHIDVTIIEQNKENAQIISDNISDATVLKGDGTNQALLREEGLRGSDAFCCLTGVDEENILTALYAKSLSDKIKTIAKINRVELVPLVEPLGIGSVVSPKMIAADRIVSYVRARQNSKGSGVLTLYKLCDGKAEALEFRVAPGSAVEGVEIAKLNLKNNVVISSINRKGKIISPRGNDTLLANDTVVVVTTHTGFDVLEDILK